MKKNTLRLLVSLVFVASTFSFKAQAISEINYKETYKLLVLPLLNNFKYGSFEGMNEMNIHYAHFTTNQKARECIVILPGKGEPIEKYAEVVHSLNFGLTYGRYQYFLMDHRGQGSSERLIPEDSYKGHVDYFENYILDVKEFMDEVVSHSGCDNSYLLAHSMGAGIGIALDMEYPGYFKKMGLISPMLKVKTTPYPYAVARAMVKANVFLGKKKEFAPGQETWTGERDFEKNKFTNSEVRYEMTMDIFDLYPKAKLGGVTNNWLYEVMKKTDDMRKHYDVSKTPSRVYIAGTELYSDEKEMERFCVETHQCEARFFKFSKHEILMDKDVNRSLAIADLLLFFR